MKTRWSAIIPTLNRAKPLLGVLTCLAAQSLPPAIFEVLVVDNGSTDDTLEQVQAFASAHPAHRIRYIREDVPGLLPGRHRGAKEAQAEVLTFFDDDVEFGPDFGAQILRAFADEQVAVAGGPCLPRFEVPPPVWLERYYHRDSEHWECGFLSLLDYGGKERDIDPGHIWGLNYSIRKTVLVALGGFHPDSTPQDLQMYQGDGESGLSFKAKKLGFLARYLPQARVTHIVPPFRLTEAYFARRSFFQGVCDSYTAIRGRKGTQGLLPPLPVRADPTKAEDMQARTRNAYAEGYLFHLLAVSTSPRLLRWVLRPDYWEYAYPPLEEGLAFPRYTSQEFLDHPLKVLRHPERVCLLAMAYLNASRPIDALRALNQVEVAYPATVGLYALKATTLYILGQTEEALSYAQKELLFCPESTMAKDIIEKVAQPDAALSRGSEPVYQKSAILPYTHARSKGVTLKGLSAPIETLDFNQALLRLNANFLKYFTDKDFVPPQSVSIRTMDPVGLLKPQRFDLAAKSIFADLAIRGLCKTWREELYLEHIRAFNNGHEGDGSGKDSLVAFLASFTETLDSLQKRGFLPTTSLIPLSRGGVLMDGAHRVGAALALQMKVPVLELANEDVPFDYAFFHKRGLALPLMDTMATEFARLLSDTRIVLLFPAAKGHTEKVLDMLAEKGSIWYVKDIYLTKTGAYSFIAQLYTGEDWLGTWENMFKGAKNKVEPCFSGKGSLRAILYQPDMDCDMIRLKEAIRAMYGIENHSVHINDTHAETMTIAHLLFNENSLHCLNTAFLRHMPTLVRLGGVYTRLLADQEKADAFCLAGSSPLAAYGLRDCADLDYLSSGPCLPKAQDISRHDSELAFYPTEPEAICHNPALHFYSHGLKFMSLACCFKMKASRKEEKDMKDMELIKKAKLYTETTG